MVRTYRIWRGSINIWIHYCQLHTCMVEFSVSSLVLKNGYHLLTFLPFWFLSCTCLCRRERFVVCTRFSLFFFWVGEGGLGGERERFVAVYRSNNRLHMIKGTIRIIFFYLFHCISILINPCIQEEKLSWKLSTWS